MQKLTEIKARMRTVEDIRNVARTMATVASAKLSRTRRRAAGMRLYAGRMREMLQRQQAYLDRLGIGLEHVSPLFVTGSQRRHVVLVHVAGDRGMCGNYNVAVNRLALEFIEEQRTQGIKVGLVCRGSKGEDYLRRKTSCDVLASHRWARAGVTDSSVEELHELVLGLFDGGGADEIWCSYTQFYSPVHRVPTILRLLPIEPGQLGSGARLLDAVEAPAVGDAPRGWSYEPAFSAVVGELVDIFLRIQLEDILLESFASENGARMVTMEEATERADKLLQECRVLHNRLSREFITTDLLGVLYASRLHRRACEDDAPTEGQVVS